MNKSITTRFSVAVVLVSVVILLVIIETNFLFIKKQLLDMADTKAKLEIFKSQNKINEILFSAINSSDDAKDTLQKTGLDKKNIEKVLSNTLMKNPNLYGMAVAMEPKIIYDSVFCPYYYKKNGKIVYVNLANESYNYLEQPWYKNVSTSRVASWSEPYFDEGGGEVLMATYSNPIFYKGKFAGVVTIDLSLENLSHIISSIHILKSGYAFLLSKNHTVLVHPKSSLIMKKYYDDKMQFNKIIKEKQRWIYYTKIESTGWIMGIVLPQKELFSSLYTLMSVSFILAFFGIAALIVTIFIVSSKITKPLKKVIQKSIDISSGNFTEHIEKPKIKDEVYQLSIAINKMQDDIKSYIENLKIATQNEQKRKSELQIASKIQTAMLPSLDLNTKNDKIKLYASLTPAKEVGGDFYDFFYLDENKICFVVADVSGKGVPASLFMAVTISYIRAYASKELTPSQIIQKVNDAICKNNETGMFVTVFLGILDIKNSTLSYINAGHPKPYLFSSIKKPQALPCANDPIIGAMEGMEFQDFQISLEANDELFIFTDGVNEAFSKDDEQFGYERIIKTLQNLKDINDKEKLAKFHKIIEEFCKGEPQSDDITMMLLTFSRT